MVRRRRILDGLKQTDTKWRRSFFPTQLGVQINFLRRNFEADRSQQIRNAFATLHCLFQTAREELHVFFVGIERKFSLGEMLRQRFVVIID